MNTYNNLKIQFRAIPYDVDSHILQWRIAPNQNLKYIKTYNIFGFKIGIPFTYNTKWHTPMRFINHASAFLYHFRDSQNWIPIFIRTIDSLEYYKDEFKTVGNFLDYVHNSCRKEKEYYISARKAYLKRHKIWN